MQSSLPYHPHIIVIVVILASLSKFFASFVPPNELVMCVPASSAQLALSLFMFIQLSLSHLTSFRMPVSPSLFTLIDTRRRVACCIYFTFFGRN